MPEIEKTWWDNLTHYWWLWRAQMLDYSRTLQFVDVNKPMLSCFVYWKDESEPATHFATWLVSNYSSHPTDGALICHRSIIHHEKWSLLLLPATGTWALDQSRGYLPDELSGGWHSCRTDRSSIRLWQDTSSRFPREVLSKSGLCLLLSRIVWQSRTHGWVATGPANTGRNSHGGRRWQRFITR